MLSNNGLYVYTARVNISSSGSKLQLVSNITELHIAQLCIAHSALSETTESSLHANMVSGYETDATNVPIIWNWNKCGRVRINILQVCVQNHRWSFYFEDFLGLFAGNNSTAHSFNLPPTLHIQSLTPSSDASNWTWIVWSTIRIRHDAVPSKWENKSMFLFPEKVQQPLSHLPSFLLVASSNFYKIQNSCTRTTTAPKNWST